MPGFTDQTVICCRRGEDEYVLLTADLGLVHAWGSRAEMLRSGVADPVLEVADRTGSARLTDPPTAGPYPWFVVDIQHGDWFVDREWAAQYCERRAADAQEA